MLGLFTLNAQGVQGSVIQMVNHGISTGGLFLIVGMVYERRHTKAIAEYGGLIKVMPRFAVVSVIVVLSSIGLPSLNGFIGEYLVLLGAFQVNPWYAAVAATGVILAAVYLLWMVQRVYFGPLTNAKNEGLSDLSLRELAVMAPIVLFIVWIGVYPGPFLSRTETSVGQFIRQVNSGMHANAGPGFPAAALRPPAQPVALHAGDTAGR